MTDKQSFLIYYLIHSRLSFIKKTSDIHESRLYRREVFTSHDLNQQHEPMFSIASQKTSYMLPGILALILLASSAPLEQFTLDFEDIDTGYATSRPRLAQRNISFGLPSVPIDDSQINGDIIGVTVTENADFARSGIRYGQNCSSPVGCEFPNDAILMEFTNVQDTVRFFVNGELESNETFRIFMYNANGVLELVATPERSDEWQQVVVVQAKGIIIDTENSEGNPFAFLLDDITFDDGMPSDLPTNSDDTFYSNNVPVDIRIALDSLGVIVSERATPSALDSLAEPLGMSFARAVNPEFYVLQTGNRTRPELTDVARQILALGSPLIVQAGLIINENESTTPMISSDQFIAQFNPGVSQAQIDAFNATNGVEIVTPDGFALNQFLLRVTQSSPTDAIGMSNVYHEDPLTVFAHPNFIQVIEYRHGAFRDPLTEHTARQSEPQPPFALIPNDPLFGNQWHHDNTGQSGGTIDADIDSDQAWDFTVGNANVTIAVLDNGFDIGHPDLTPNLWVNPGEIPGNGMDDDGNNRVDDVNGWDFTACDGATVTVGCGDNNPSPGAGNNHGTAVAGVAAARGNNAIGVTGSCMNCSFIPMRINLNVGAFSQSQAFGYASTVNANVMVNSWGYAIGTTATTAVVNAINNAAANGSLIMFAMRNGNVNDCTTSTPDISSLNSVMGISASSNQDRKVTESAFGNCMEVLAPTHRGYGPNRNNGTTGVAYSGTLNIPTTDRRNNAGYNNTSPQNSAPSFDPTFCPAETGDRNYTLCFGGTSSATPLTAGVAGLIFSADPTLNRFEVQRLLQDTADKIEESAAQYDPDTGFSMGATGTATHGYGRINSYESVKIAAPTTVGGQAGVDVFLRDNYLDWGNTEQPSNVVFEPVTRGFEGHWQSPDIKVDAFPFQTPPTDGASFDALIHENPRTGITNRVYVRVRNRGPRTASSVDVKLMWTQFGTALPMLALDFWSAFPADPTIPSAWTILGTETLTDLGYSGSSVASTTGDASQIAVFDWVGPSVAAGTPNHFCLFAVAESPTDQVDSALQSEFQPDAVTPFSNNVTHRNVRVVGTGGLVVDFTDVFVFENPYDFPIITELWAPDLPISWTLALSPIPLNEPIELGPGEKIFARLDVDFGGGIESGELDLIQAIDRPDVPNTMGDYDLFGGISLVFGTEFEQDIGNPERYIANFTLIDAAADQVIPEYDPIPPNAFIDMTNLPSQQLSVRANAIGETGSVTFDFNGENEFRTENVVPYALFGDISGDYASIPLQAGMYEVNATPFSELKGQGDAGPTASVSFTLWQPSVESFTLIDTDADQPVTGYDPIAEGAHIDLSMLSTYNLSIRANVSDSVESVSFDLNSGLEQRIENVEPYSLFGDVGGDYAPKSLREGAYVLLATPYTEDGGQGAKGQSLTLNFSLVQSAASKRTETAGMEIYPNPFNPVTQIRYAIQERGHVKLTVYDVLGRQVALLVDGIQNQGQFQAEFNASGLSSGVYLVRLDIEGAPVQTQRILLSK